MRTIFPKLFLAAVFLSFLPFTPAAGQTLPVEPATRLLVDRIGNFKAAGAATTAKSEIPLDSSNDFGATSAASRKYLSKDGQHVWLTIVITKSDSGAYALLTNSKRSAEKSGIQEPQKSDVGTASFALPDRLSFARGSAFVAVNRDDAKASEPQALVEIGKAFAETLDKGEGAIPVLVKHLPDWSKVEPHVLYATTPNTLKEALSNQPVLDVVRFEGGAEAVLANYDSGKLVIIEFNTARIAGDNDWNIRTKINELRSPNQPVGTVVPSAYRRVGNYSVFVFDAPNEQAANQLIDQVKYQQVVQWLGENPYLYEDAQREFVETTLGVFVAVVKGSGVALVACLAIGGIFGTLLFIRRRAQQRAVEAYSDAGGMLRLNLDEMTPKTDATRLLGPRT